MSRRCDSWGANLRKEVWEFWKDLENEYPGWEDGFQVFFGPVNETAPILILGINPGGDADAFENNRENFEAGDFCLDSDHHYLRKGDESPALGDEMLDLIGETIIRNSVKSNVNFFRSANTDLLDERLEGVSSPQEKCFEWVDEIIERVNPEIILCEGLRAYNDVRGHIINSNTQECTRREIAGKNCKIVCVAETETCPVIGIPHLSGQAGQYYNYTDEHKQLMQDTIYEEVERNTDLTI